MPLDQKLLNELINIFKSELAERTIIITNSLLQLEKGVESEVEKKSIMESIFRAAHNLKGAARGLGITNVGEIAHQMETLFADIINKKTRINQSVINVCLESVDRMQEASQAFINNKPLSYDIQELLNKIANVSTDQVPIADASIETPKSTNNKTIPPTPQTIPTNDSEYVRVRTDRIEKLSSVMEEIQANKIGMVEHLSDLKNLSNLVNQYLQDWKLMPANSQMPGANRFILDMVSITQSVSHVQHVFNNKINSLSMLANQLQDEVSMLRLVPASVLLFTLPRYIRDLSNDLHKKVNLEVKGENVKIDKLVLDGLKDPINHLIRNALDHGLEDSETRLAANKSEYGTLTIEFRDMGNEIIISISDDGAGINRKIVTDVAEKNKLYTREELQGMTDAEIIDLIFLPGFSTKKTVTDISGRGVGLDVVKSNLVGLKGHISVDSKVGVGTTFTLRVPLTLSSERGLFVKCGELQVVLPTNYIHSVMICSQEDIENVSGGTAIIIDKDPIPYLSLSNVLAISSNNMSRDKLPTVVVSNSNYTVAFLVDKIIGEREIIIKSLQEPLNCINYVNGATLLENNQLAIVLDVDDLIKSALNVKHDAVIQVKTDKQDEHQAKIHILVVDDSITTRTLEKNVLENKNYQVTTAVNGQEAWELLQKQAFSLMITDISMPIMDGLTLTQRVKSDDKLRDLPVIIVTSLGTDAEKARGVEVGADAYIVKSEFESSALLDAIEQLVQS